VGVGDHSQEDLAKFGYRSHKKFKKKFRNCAKFGYRSHKKFLKKFRNCAKFVLYCALLTKLLLLLEYGKLNFFPS
jgi:hypothetical protein